MSPLPVARRNNASVLLPPSLSPPSPIKSSTPRRRMLGQRQKRPSFLPRVHPRATACVRVCTRSFVHARIWFFRGVAGHMRPSSRGLRWQKRYVTRPSTRDSSMQFTPYHIEFAKYLRSAENNTVTALLETDLYAERQLLHVCICICLQKMPWNTLGSHANTPMVYFTLVHITYRLFFVAIIIPKTKQKTSEGEREDKHTLPILASGHLERRGKGGAAARKDGDGAKIKHAALTCCLSPQTRTPPPPRLVRSADAGGLQCCDSRRTAPSRHWDDLGCLRGKHNGCERRVLGRAMHVDSFKCTFSGAENGRRD